MQKSVREFVKWLRSVGLHADNIERGRHYKITICAPDGRALTYSMPVSTSDARSELNRKKDVLRHFHIDEKGQHRV